MARGQARLFGVAGLNPPDSVSILLSDSNVKGSCPESLVVRGQARLFGVAGLNPPGSVSTLLSKSMEPVERVGCRVCWAN